MAQSAEAQSLMDILKNLHSSSGAGEPMPANGLQPLDEASPGRSSVSNSYFIALACVILIVSLGGGIAAVVLLARSDHLPGGLEVAAVAGLLALGGCGVALALLAVRAERQAARLIEQVVLLEQRTAVLAEQSVARSRAEPALPEPAGATPSELAALLADIRDILLLPQELRIRRYQTLAEAEFHRRLQAADRFIATRDFHRARDELTALAERFGADERIGEARARLERAAEEARAQDITQAVAHAQDLMSLGKWEETEQLARELGDKYPAATEPAALRDRVAQERRLFAQRHRQRMLDEIQQQVRQRRWREAADGTRRFLDMFPQDIEAPPLREQLQTLDANAEIQSRQLLEQQYKELLAQRRYWDALGLARRIIGEYPFSPQANALRSQVARVEELARRHEPQA